MTEINVAFTNRSASLGRRPHVRKHTINWELADSSLPVQIRLGALGKALNKGCHFLNPLYTVTSHQPSVAFYRKTLWARNGWINLFRKTLARGDFNEHSKKLGVSDRQYQISGVTYLNGEWVRPDVLEHNLRLAENPELGLITTARRRVNLDYLRTPEGQQILLAMTRSELREILSSRPKAALYVTPATTLLAPGLTLTFLTEARDAEDQWHGRLRSQLGNQARSLARSADLPSKMLLFRGVLAANGRAYRPGHWPYQNLSEGGPFSNQAMEGSISWGDLGLA